MEAQNSNELLNIEKNGFSNASSPDIITPANDLNVSNDLNSSSKISESELEKCLTVNSPKIFTLTSTIIAPENDDVPQLSTEPEAMLTLNIDENVLISNNCNTACDGNGILNSIDEPQCSMNDSSNDTVPLNDESLFFIDKREIETDIEIDPLIEETSLSSAVELPEDSTENVPKWLGERRRSSSLSDSDSDSISLPDMVLTDDSNDSFSINRKTISAQKIKPVYSGVKTRGELDLQDLPPIEDLHITVSENDIHHIGKVSSIVSCLVVVQSFENEKALDLDSVLFTKNGTSLGKVFDVFGRVVAPFYAVRFNSESEITSQGVSVGDDVFSAPSHEDVTNYVFAEKLLRQRGSDASWKDNNEPPDECLEFSDDEQERYHRQKIRAKRKGNSDVTIIEETVKTGHDKPQHSGRQTKTPRMPRPVICPPRFQNTNSQAFQQMPHSGFIPNQNQFPPQHGAWSPNNFGRPSPPNNFGMPSLPNNFGPYNPFGFYNPQQPFPQPMFGQMPWGHPGYMLPNAPGFPQSTSYGPQCFSPGGSFRPTQQNFGPQLQQASRFSGYSFQNPSGWPRNISALPPPPPPPSPLSNL